jgi:hypothetical protein
MNTAHRISDRLADMASFNLLLVALLLAACSPVGENERLWVTGELEREGIYDHDPTVVAIDYLSETSRGEWWPCDLRATASGCVGDHHVNVYVALPNVVELEGLGRADCVIDDIPYGVYELFDENDGGKYSLGSEISVFVVIASDVVDEVPGANLEDDNEATASSRFASGELTVTKFSGLEDNIAFKIDGTTNHGNEVLVEFHGPMGSPGAVPTLEGPNTCVDDALVEQ